jgi:hypothetical protein
MRATHGLKALPTRARPGSFEYLRALRGGHIRLAAVVCVVRLGQPARSRVNRGCGRARPAWYPGCLSRGLSM